MASGNSRDGASAGRPAPNFQTGMAGIGLVLKWPVAIELEFVEDMIGRR